MPRLIRVSRSAPDNLPRPAHWGSTAVCRAEDVPPSLFFPEDEGAGLVAIVTEEAKSYCRRCPAEVECLADALRRREPFGVWGGLDAEERRALLRPRESAEVDEAVSA